MKIVKRDGSYAEYDRGRITDAIFKAVLAVGGKDYKQADRLSQDVDAQLAKLYKRKNHITIEDVQDTVEHVLIEAGHAKTAKAFIIYRQKRTELRESKKDILDGLEDKSHLNINQLRIAAAKYLKKDSEGKIVETPLAMFKRVAKHVASIEKKGKQREYEEKFYEIMRNLDFIPGGRTLANAGTHINQLANCFVIPINDSLEEIFDAVKEQAIIQKLGGGTGFDFSRLRPNGSYVRKSTGTSSGPVSFIKVFDAATKVISQGNRKGANMGMLRIDHPDIIDFIQLKDDLEVLNQFNISISITDKFMEAVRKRESFDLVNPITMEKEKSVDATELFNLITTHAWLTGEPGLMFIDEINRKNPTKHNGPIEATDPCGLVPLHPYESCNIGSINLNNFVKNKKIDWPRLKDAVQTAVRFLDNVIDVANYPLSKVEKVVKANRRVGLGILGWADMLYQLKLPYDSHEAIKTADKLMRFIKKHAYETSASLAKERDVFPSWKGSLHHKKGKKMRNATLLSIAPNGTLSMLAETSGGIEPNFAICYVKKVLDGEQFMYVNTHFRQAAHKAGIATPALMKKIAEHGTVRGMKEIPQNLQKIFTIAHDVAPQWHIRMQSAFQKHVDNSISKTINFPRNSTVKDVEKGFLLSHEMKCKGVTVYRDGSREDQVLKIKEVSK